MQIAFYAPLKPPDHPVPSGDRLMARLLIRVLTLGGSEVTVASELRAFLRSADDHEELRNLQSRAAETRAELAALWHTSGAPDAWFCYHPYYKSPDLLGPPLCAAFGLPYITAEASVSNRRNIGIWADLQADLRTSIANAAVNVCMTARDREGLLDAVPGARTARLRPFIDIVPVRAATEAMHLVTIAMMRTGDKMESYVHLARALQLIAHVPWTLSIIGDGPARAEVEALFSGFAPDRIVWHGQLEAKDIADILSRAALYVWPGCHEAYGLAYLEAQAAGVPVVAFRTAGVPEVVADSETGLLTPDGDDPAFAAAIGRLLSDEGLRLRLSVSARIKVARDHSTGGAATAMRQIIKTACGTRQ